MYKQLHKAAYIQNTVPETIGGGIRFLRELLGVI